MANAGYMNIKQVLFFKICPKLSSLEQEDDEAEQSESVAPQEVTQ